MKKIGTKLLYVFAFLLVLLAVAVIVARLMTPLLNEHRSYFENFVSDVVKAPVHIGKVEAWWDGFQPDIKINDVTVFSDDKQKEIFHINELQVDVSVIRSVYLRRLQPSHIIIDGFYLLIHRLGEGDYKVNGIRKKAIAGAQQLAEFNYHDAIDLLFTQPFISLRNVRIDWKDRDKPIIPVLIKKLNFTSGNNVHALNGFVATVQESPAKIYFHLLMQGSVDDAKHLKAMVYAKIYHLDFAQLRDHLAYKDYQIKDGYFNGQVWLQWKHLQLQSIQSVFNLKSFQLKVPKINQLMSVDQLAANVNCQKTNGQWRLNAAFNNLQFQRWQKIPGVRNLSGIIGIKPNNGYLQLNSNNLVIDFGRLFLKPFSLNYLSGYVQWHQQADKSWLIQSKPIVAINDRVALHGQAGLLIPGANGDPIISILAGFNFNDPTQVKWYLPVSVLNKKTVDWLSQAFVNQDGGGSGTLILRGKASQFPFDKSVGTFVVDSKIHDIALHYAPDWPGIKKINGELIFNGRSMLCNADSGFIGKAKIKNARAEIPFMGKDKHVVVNVDGEARGDAEDMLRFVQDSPLSHSFGENLSMAHMKGDTHLNLKLSIPTATTEKNKVSGNVQFVNVAFNIPAWKIMLDKLNGRIAFTNKDVSSEVLTGYLFNQPIALNLETLHEQDKTPFTRVNLKGNVGVKALEQQFHWPEIPHITGNADYQAQIDLRSAKGDKRQNLLNISSDLYGINVDFPAPLSKPANQIEPFSMNLWFGADKQSRSILQVGKRLSAALLFAERGGAHKLFSINVRFGPGLAKAQTQEGLYITGYLPTLDWQAWSRFIKPIEEKMPMEQDNRIKNTLKKILRVIDVRLGKIEILGQKLINARVKIEPKKSVWQINVINQRIRGYLLFNKNFPNVPLAGRFKKLFLQKIKGLEKKDKKFNPGSIPAFNIQADNFRYGDQYYGAVNLEVQSAKDVLYIKNLTVKSPLLSGKLYGSWRMMGDDNYKTHLVGKMSCFDIDKFLKVLDIRSSLLATQGAASFDLTWPDTVFQPSLNKLFGNVSVNLGKGWIIDLGEDTLAKLNLGRILTSLDISRIFTADIPQLTNKGYNFDKMEGDFYFQRGVVSSRNLFFDGPVARIGILGRANMITSSLNLNMQVTPYVTSSIPVVAAIAGGPVFGPVIGAATWIANKMLSPIVSKFTTYRYAVTGTWKKPVIISN